MPSVTRLPLEAHPFSFANIPSQNNGSPMFLIRVHEDATKLLRDSLGSDECTSLPIKLEGPYGVASQLGEFSTVVLFAGLCTRTSKLTAGGTGIAHSMSTLLSVLESSRSPSSTRLVHLIWHTRSSRNIDWIGPFLATVTEALKDDRGIAVKLDIYITRCSSEYYEDHRAQRALYDNGHCQGEITGLRDTVQVPQASPSRSLHPALHYIEWHSGRADLRRVVAEDRQRSEGPIHVSGKHGSRVIADKPSLWSVLTYSRSTQGCQRQHIATGIDAGTVSD